MAGILTALGRALRDLREPRIVAIMFLPALGALAIWATLSWIFWDPWTAWLKGLATGTAAGRWLEALGAGWLIQSLSVLGLFALLAPATLITVMVIAELVAMPVIVAWVGERYHAGLARKAGGTFAGSVLNTIIGIIVFSVLWLVTLPLWFTGVGAFVLPPVLSAYLNQRLFRYDALGEHASAEEYRALLAAAKGRLFWLGLVLAVFYYVPLVNLLAPVLSGLAFTHLCLDELVRLRAGD
ncbi:MAG: EI24 domain-containing protein [Betaproteobacteria bacterium]|nr:EI24 domain-containing protein [Betaproteobacteria bacterium]